MRKLSSNTRERTQDGEKELRTTLISKVLKLYSEKQFGRAILRMLTILQLYLHYYEVRPTRRVLELQNEDLWIWLKDLSWHFPIVVTFRELLMKDYRERSVANLEASNEEAKKQKDSEKQKSQI